MQARSFRFQAVVVVGTLVVASIMAGCASQHGARGSRTASAAPGEKLMAVEWPDDLITTSERSDFQATETHAEVVAIMDRIADRSPLATRATMGQTFEGRELPLLILADPPVSTASEAKDSGKLIVYLQAAIHGGEVCGKPALLQLARDIALNDESPDRWLLEDMIIVMCPVYNADGNDRIEVGNRGSAQDGPALGMGERANAQGFDLNRDHVKLESPEAQSLAAFLTEWNPHLTIDSHTTNGSLHEYALTYSAPQNPSGHPAPIEFVRDQMLPSVSETMESRTGLKSFFYGNFDRERTVWATYSHMPRFATPYRGLRNRMSILAEAYAYDTYEERVVSTREFIRECLYYAAAYRDDIVAILDLAERATVGGSSSAELVGIQYEIAAFDEPVTIPAFERIVDESGEPTGELRSVEYTVDHYGWFEQTKSVVRPDGYIIAPELDQVVEKLRQHGVVIEQLPAIPSSAMIEQYVIGAVDHAERQFQGHHVTTVEVSDVVRLPWREDRVPPGSWFVPMNQPLANLAIYLLEPESDDGLVAWGFVDGFLEVGGVFPVTRLVSSPLR